MKRFHKPLSFAALALIALWSAFFYAPTETTMGDLQRIFYFHVPAAVMGFVAALVVAFAGMMFLATEALKWDHLRRVRRANGRLCLRARSSAQSCAAQNFVI